MSELFRLMGISSSSTQNQIDLNSMIVLPKLSLTAHDFVYSAIFMTSCAEMLYFDHKKQAATLNSYL